MLGRETDTATEILQITRPDVGGHDDDGIPEIHLAAQAIGQNTVVQHLQQDIEHIRVRFLDFIEQYHAVGLATDFFRQLSAFFVAHVAGRRSHQARYAEFLHVFAHVDPHQRIVLVEEDR